MQKVMQKRREFGARPGEVEEAPFGSREVCKGPNTDPGALIHARKVIQVPTTSSGRAAWTFVLHSEQEGVCHWLWCSMDAARQSR